MPDFKTFVRGHISRLGLPPDREQKIVEEWATQLEEIYEGFRAEGFVEGRRVARAAASAPRATADLMRTAALRP
jgi:hypothetical protein